MDASTGLGLELTHAQPGRSRKALATRPVSGVLQDLGLHGDADALDLWHEWERESKGKRQVGFSKGLRERFAPSVAELSDEQVAELEHGTRDDDLVHFDRDGWRCVIADPSLPPAILDAAEASGLEGVVRLLESREVPYSLVGQQRARNSVE
jgi:hypothetical protein